MLEEKKMAHKTLYAKWKAWNSQVQRHAKLRPWWRICAPMDTTNADWNVCNAEQKGYPNVFYPFFYFTLLLSLNYKKHLDQSSNKHLAAPGQLRNQCVWKGSESRLPIPVLPFHSAQAAGFPLLLCYEQKRWGKNTPFSLQCWYILPHCCSVLSVLPWQLHLSTSRFAEASGFSVKKKGKISWSFPGPMHFVRGLTEKQQAWHMGKSALGLVSAGIQAKDEVSSCCSALALYSRPERRELLSLFHQPVHGVYGDSFYSIFSWCGE